MNAPDRAGAATTPVWPYVATGGATGHFSLAAPKVEDVHVNWLALALARQPRWNGQTDPALPPYSVAQHSCWVADQAWEATGDPEIALAALLHDAHEAVFGDIPTPVKLWLQGLGMERRRFDCAVMAIDQAIHAAFGLAFPLLGRGRAVVKHFDQVALVTEWRDLMPPPRPALLSDEALAKMPRPWGCQVRPWTGGPREAAAIFTASAETYVRLAGLEAPALARPATDRSAA